jgi:hypothetical protein
MQFWTKSRVLLLTRPRKSPRLAWARMLARCCSSRTESVRSLLQRKQLLALCFEASLMAPWFITPFANFGHRAAQGIIYVAHAQRQRYRFSFLRFFLFFFFFFLLIVVPTPQRLVNLLTLRLFQLIPTN